LIKKDVFSWVVPKWSGDCVDVRYFIFFCYPFPFFVLGEKATPEDQVLVLRWLVFELCVFQLQHWVWIGVEWSVEDGQVDRKADKQSHG